MNEEKRRTSCCDAVSLWFSIWTEEELSLLRVFDSWWKVDQNRRLFSGCLSATCWSSAKRLGQVWTGKTPLCSLCRSKTSFFRNLLEEKVYLFVTFSGVKVKNSVQEKYRPSKHLVDYNTEVNFLLYWPRTKVSGLVYMKTSEKLWNFIEFWRFLYKQNEAESHRRRLCLKTRLKWRFGKTLFACGKEEV